MRKAVIQLGMAETIIWAGTFYLFPALMVVWEREFAWTKAELAGGFTIALALSAIGSPVAGALIDRGFGSRLLCASALAGGCLLGALSFIDSLLGFYLVWAGIGLSMAGSLYEPCFAFVIRNLGSEARNAITAITLVAGFAGAISFPAANVLSDAFGWRVAVLVFCGIVCFVAVPLFWFSANELEARGSRIPAAPGPLQVQKEASLGSPVFWLLAVALGLLALNHGMVITHLLPILYERSISPTLAVLAAATIGPMQVVGRLALAATGERVTPVAGTVAYIAAVGLSCGLLLAAGASEFLIVSFAALYGASWGIGSVLKPLVTRDLLGVRNFGTVAGYLAVPFLAAIALGPFLGARLWEIGGYDLMILAGIFMIAVALGSHLIAAAWARKSNP